MHVCMYELPNNASNCWKNKGWSKIFLVRDNLSSTRSPGNSPGMPVHRDSFQVASLAIHCLYLKTVIRHNPIIVFTKHSYTCLLCASFELSVLVAVSCSQPRNTDSLICNIFKAASLALTGVAQWVGHCPPDRMVTSLIPVQVCA